MWGGHRGQYPTAQKVTNLLAALITVVVAAIGIVLLMWTSDSQKWQNYPSLQSFLSTLGSLCFVSVTISLIWALFGKRAFAEELMAKANISRNVYHAGLLEVAASKTSVKWLELMGDAAEVDLWFTYNPTWRDMYDDQLRAIAKRKRAVIRVLLPDPDEPGLMASLARRFDRTKEHLSGRIQEARDYFLRMKLTAEQSGSTVEIWYTSAAPMFGLYRFDGVLVLSLYGHCGYQAVPHLVCRRGGSLYAFAMEQFNALVEEARQGSGSAPAPSPNQPM